MQPVHPVPQFQLSTRRGLLKMIIFGILTFGIYPIVIYSKISSEIDIIASRYDGKRTMHFCLMYFIFSWLTLGIAYFVWYHRISNRIGNELKRRGIPYNFGASDFWLWNILGSLILIGPFVYVHKFMKASNLMNADFNQKG